MLFTSMSTTARRVDVTTHCRYCAFRWGIRLLGEGAADMKITADAACSSHRGRRRVKGVTAAATRSHADRLTSPLARNRRGILKAVSWDAALDRIASEVRRIQVAFGRDAVGVYGSGALTNE